MEASLGPKSVARLKIDGEEVSKKSFSGLLTVQPIDGLQIGRDLAAAVGDYKTPYSFKGEIKSATLEAGDEIPQPPFVDSVPSGGKIPAMKVTEQAKHPLPDRDKYGGFMSLSLKATGNFRVEKVNGRWVFVTPDGHPFIAIGANHTGPTIRNQGQSSGLWAKYENSPDVTAQRILPIYQSMGFTAGDVYQPESTYTRTLPWISFFWYGDANQTFVDVFDESTMLNVTRRAFEHAASLADNPSVLGIGGPDLPIWDDKLVRKYRQLSREAPGRIRYAAFLRDRYSSRFD